ncbi:MAG: ABC transporter ATP-binding protein [Thermoleophilia bacterium]|nr:ABC transporter ATP-binding protein [Thermoleophilia bacterium]
MTALLEIQQVVKSFGGVRAVDGAAFEVAAGSITALIGPNGAGKSTLFNCVAGSLRPDAGRIVFAGRRIDRLPTHRIARAGLVRTFQSARALARMTVLDNLLLASIGHPGERLSGLLLRPRAARAHERALRERARELLDLVGLQAHADAYAGTLSGGQRKLLDLARVLMLEPTLVLLDEPMAGVSPRLRVELLDHILALRRERGITFLIIEHDLDFVMQAAEKIVVMNEGRVIAQGDPASVQGDQAVVDAYLGTAAVHEQPAPA